jgi:xanthosine utilization system XapX-like protein
MKGVCIMKVKHLTMSAILLAIGAILHYIVPGIFAGMKPDFLLSMMFLAIFINFNATNVAATSIACGLISALTTTFPGGQIPNIIDKCITGFVVGLLIYALRKIPIPQTLKMGIIGLIGTLISGTAFLGSAYLLVGLPGGASFGALFMGVVIPASIGNVIFIILFYQIIARIGLSRETLSE